MQDQDGSQKDSESQEGGGWLVLRIKPGEGVVLGNGVELRLATINNHHQGDVKVAVRAPREITIRRVK